MLSRLNLPADTPSRLFLLAFALFLLSQFVITRDKSWDFFFYLAVIPTLLAVLFARPINLGSFLSSRGLQLVLALLGWLCLTLLWREGADLNDAFQYVRRTALVLTFLLCALVFFRLASAEAERFFWLSIILTAGICAALSLISYHGGWQPEAVRLEAIGQLEQSILGAAVYGVAGLTALHFLVTRMGRPTALYAAIYLIIATLIFFTYSRGQLMAFSVSSCFVLACHLSPRWRLRFIALSISVAALAGLLLLTTNLANLEALHMLLRDSYRLGIWQQTLELIAQKPLFGWGAGHPFNAQTDGIYAPHAHNLLLGTLYYSGLVGGLLLLAMLTAPALALWRAAPSPTRLLASALLLHAVLSVITDNATLVDSPEPFWTFFWLPLTYIIAKTGDRT